MQTQAGLFKLDFGQMENEKIPIDPETGEPSGEAPAPLTDGRTTKLLKGWISLLFWILCS